MHPCMKLVEGMRHTGIVVSDLPKALYFYRDILGLELISEQEEVGKFIEQVTGLADVRLRWAKLRSPDGFVIELLQYLSHPMPSSFSIQSSERPGCSHIAFRVGNLDEVYKVLSERGATFKGAPAISPDAFAKVVYGHDPEANILEFVEILKSS